MPAGLAVQTAEGWRSCDESCWSATGPAESCVCCCRAANHGIGTEEAERRLSRGELDYGGPAVFQPGLFGARAVEAVAPPEPAPEPPKPRRTGEPRCSGCRRLLSEVGLALDVDSGRFCPSCSDAEERRLEALYAPPAAPVQPRPRTTTRAPAARRTTKDGSARKRAGRRK